MPASRYASWLALALLLLAAALPAHAILPIQHWQTSNGARVYFIENRDLPMLDISVEFPAGAGYDRADRSGVAAMTNRLLTAGAEGLSEDDVARAMADVGAQLGGRFDTDRAGLSVRTLSSGRERNQALDVMGRLLRSPSFPQAVLERERVRLIGALKESDTQPGTIASENFYRLVYPGHSYGLRSSGDVETVQKLTREDLAQFHRRHYAARYAVVALIGDVTRADAEAIAEQVTRRLPPAQGAEPELQPVAPLPAGSTRRIPHH